ncbi:MULTISPECIES: hypothetical protein [unclassified Kitasatospora]|uniref:hypothetical protein n=1 Tax=unclassified Kitasatospora TaxID=2633591 RepID=UPI003800AD91
MVTLAGILFQVVHFTDIVDDCWSVEYQSGGREGLFISVSRPFDGPADQLEVFSTGELSPNLRAVALAHARVRLSDGDE